VLLVVVRVSVREAPERSFVTAPMSELVSVVDADELVLGVLELLGVVELVLGKLELLLGLEALGYEVVDPVLGDELELGIELDDELEELLGALVVLLLSVVVLLELDSLLEGVDDEDGELVAVPGVLLGDPSAVFHSLL
jgi:hypothetical protein